MPRRRSPKNKTKKPKPKDDKQPRPRVRVPRTRASAPRRLPFTRTQLRQVCSNADPFCDAANGGKYLDLSSARTLAFPKHSRFVITTNASGEGAVLAIPSYLYQPIVYATAVAAGVATFAGVMPLSGNLDASSYRLVSMGFRLRNITAPLSSSGMLRIRGFNAIAGASVLSVPTAGYNCDFYEDIALQNVNEVAVIVRRTDPSAKNFRDPFVTNPTNLLTNMVMPGFGCVLVAVDGAPASVTVVDIEVICNYEVSIQDTDTIAQLATPAPIYDPTSETISNIVTSTGKSVFIKGAAQVAKSVEEHAISLLSSRLSAMMMLP